MDQSMSGQKCGCAHHSMVPVYLILMGLLFLVHAFGVFTSETVGIIWPILLILIGIQKMMSGKCKCCAR